MRKSISLLFLLLFSVPAFSATSAVSRAPESSSDGTSFLSTTSRVPLNTSTTPHSGSMDKGSPVDSPFFREWDISSFANTATAFTIQGRNVNSSNVSSAVKHNGGVFGECEDTSAGALVYCIGIEGYTIGKGSGTYPAVVGHSIFTGNNTYTAALNPAFMSSVEIFEADGTTPADTGLGVAYYAPAISGGSSKFSFLGTDPLKTLSTIYSFGSSGTKSTSISHDNTNGALTVSSGALTISPASGSGILLGSGTAFYAPLTANQCSLGASGYEFSDLWLAGKMTKYNNIATVSNGVPAEYATVDLTGQTGAVSTTTLYTPTASGLYRISAQLKITTTGTSPVAGPITITWTDADGSVAQSQVMALTNTSGAIVTTTVNNSTTTGTVYGSMVIYAKTGVAIQYAIAVSGTFGVGQYSAHLKCEAL